MGRKKKRSKKVAETGKKRHLRSLVILCFMLLPPTLYLSYCISGLFLIEVDISRVKEQLAWCVTHPFLCYNDRTAGVVATGFLIWLIAGFSAYIRRNYNFMPGNEYGSARWGSIKAFNAKYAAADVSGTEKETGLSEKNKVLSENIRFRYDSDTLRNNNILVVGGSGAGKTSFFLTPNLLSLHDCNIYTDPKGGLVEELGGWLAKQKDTKVYVLNMCEMEKSLHFNPFLYINKRSDITRLVTNLIQNTDTEKSKHSNADPFWERAERMFLESLFLYVWMECPRAVLNEKEGKADMMGRDWKSIMLLLDEAQFGTGDKPPKLDARMKQLEKKKPGHPAVRAYTRYRGGPDETIRSVLMTVNARMQPFDNEELLEIFSDNEIPLDEFGIGKDGDGKTKSNLFVVIPDDDDTYNFVPGMVYTLLFQSLYRQARVFGGKLPMDVGFWFDEFSNIKMPNNFDKILATCRSRGVYCVPILQSLAQLKTLFADGAWEGVAGNCDTFLYLGGNESSTFEYISKLLGKWTIDKRTYGESKGSSGSTSENLDVLGRELMQEYEIRGLPDDECILFVRGENPIRDKKWFPWEHEEYMEARKCGAYLPDREADEWEDGMGSGESGEDGCEFISDSSLDYLKKLEKKGETVRIYGMDAYEFMMLDMDKVMKKVHGVADEKEKSDLIRPDMIRDAIEVEEKRNEEICRREFVERFPRMTLLDIFSSEMLSSARRNVIRELLAEQAKEEDIKSIIRPELTEAEVQAKKKAWMEMRGR